MQILLRCVVNQIGRHRYAEMLAEQLHRYAEMLVEQLGWCLGDCAVMLDVLTPEVWVDCRCCCHLEVTASEAQERMSFLARAASH